MKIVSQHRCGFRRDGGVLLEVGENAIDESKLTTSEAAFIDALIKAGAAKKIEEPPAPLPRPEVLADEPVHVARPAKRRKAG